MRKMASDLPSLHPTGPMRTIAARGASVRLEGALVVSTRARSLLLFADPGCVSCRDALRAFERLISELPEEMRALVITSSESILVDAVEEFKTTSVDLGRIEDFVLVAPALFWTA